MQPATVQPAPVRGPEHFAIGSDTDSAGADSTASLPYVPADLSEWELPDVPTAAPTAQPSLLQGGLAAAPRTPIVPPKKPPPPLCPERVVRPAGKKPPPPLYPERVVRPEGKRKAPPPTIDEPRAKRKAPPPTLEESRPPTKRPPVTPWIPSYARPPFGKPQVPLPPTAVPTGASLRAPPPPPKVTTALVPWDYTYVREQAPVTPLRAAPLSPPKARALQGAAPVVDQAWADIANDEEYILPATWYARPPTEAAPATPTEMPPLPPDAADAAPALVVYTEDSWPRVRIEAPLGPLVPTERPVDDTNLPLPWTLPGALQGDEELPPSGEPDEEVEKNYPDVRLSRNSRLVPQGYREEKLCMLCYKAREPEIRNFCP